MNLSLCTNQSLLYNFYTTTFAKENPKTIGDVFYRINHLALASISMCQGVEAAIKTTLNGIMALLPLTDKKVYLKNLHVGCDDPFNALEDSLAIPFDHFLRALNPATFRPTSVYQLPFNSISVTLSDWIPSFEQSQKSVQSPSFFDRECKTRFHLTVHLLVITVATIADLAIAVFSCIGTLITFGSYEPLDELCDQSLKSTTEYARFFATLSYLIYPKNLKMAPPKPPLTFILA